MYSDSYFNKKSLKSGYLSKISIFFSIVYKNIKVPYIYIYGILYRTTNEPALLILRFIFGWFYDGCLVSLFVYSKDVLLKLFSVILTLT